MKIEDLDIGDVVYAAHSIVNDGSVPDADDDAVLAKQGARGVITMKGHIEEQPERCVFLVRFEDEALNLGKPIGCLVEDLLMETATS
jgi:nitrogen fixation protein NifZ